jgi:hypothetical protein
MTNEEAKEFLDNLKICIEEHPVVADWLVEIADRKTEPQTNGYQTFNGTSVYVSRIEDEVQAYKPTCNGECRNCDYRAKDGNYCMKTDCAWK